MENARQFADAEELQEAMRRAGVADQPDGYFLEEVETSTTVSVRPRLLRPFFRLYSPYCVEWVFSEVRRSKRPAALGSRHPRAAWWHRFGVGMLRPNSVRCSVV